MKAQFISQTLAEFRRGIPASSLRTEYPPGDPRRYGPRGQPIDCPVAESMRLVKCHCSDEDECPQGRSPEAGRCEFWVRDNRRAHRRDNLGTFLFGAVVGAIIVLLSVLAPP